MRARWPLLLLLLALLLPALPRARADDGDEPAPAPAPAPAPVPAPAPEDGGGEASTERPPRLHKIYVPYKDLREILSKEGEGVFIPEQEFEALWRRAYGEGEAPATAPVPAMLRSVLLEGEAEGDVLRLVVRVEAEGLAPGWHRLPLAFDGAGVDAVSVEGEGALVVATEHRYELLLRGEGRRTVELHVSVPATGPGDARAASLALPPAPVTRLVVTLPGERTDVAIEPRTAYTTRPTGDGRTRLEASLGAVGTARLVWRTRTDEAERVEALVFADEAHDVRIDRGVVRSELTAVLSILRAPLARLRVAVPPEAVTLYVQGDGIRTWTRSEDGRAIDVELREPVRERWALRVGLEEPLPDLPAEVTLPLALVDGAERETGFLRLLQGEGVKVEPRAVPGLLQVDVAELPEGLRDAPAARAVAWRFPARPGAVTARVEALAPRLGVAVGTRVVVRPEGTALRMAADLVVERAGIFGVAFDLPADLDVTAVRVQGVPYDDHVVREEEGGRRVLQVAFRDRLLGRGRVEVDGRRTTPLPDAAEGAPREATLEVPVLRIRDASYERGFIAIHVDGSLEHRVTAKTGVTPLDASAPVALEPPPLEGTPVPLVHRFEHHEGPVRLTLAMRRKDPVVTASVESAIRLEPNRSRLEVTLRYGVLYRAVDTLRFTAPAALAGRIHVETEGVRLLGPAPVEPGGDGDGARATWTLRLDPPRQGELPVSLQIDDLEHEPLASGGSLRVAVPTFVPVGDDAAPLPNVVHHLAVRRDPLLEVMGEDVQRAEEIDARELPPALASEDNFLAWRSYDPAWSIVVGVVRHDYEEVAEVVVTHMHLETVVAEGGRATTDAFLVVLNNDRQYLTLHLPPGAEIRGVTVDGRARTPRQADAEGAILVPLLSGLGKDESFVVALAFDHEVDWSNGGFCRVGLVSPWADDVRADLLTWRVWVPSDRLWTGFGGDLEPADPYRSWFAGVVDGVTSRVGRRVPSARVPIGASLDRFESPFATRREGRAFLFVNRTGTGGLTLHGGAPGLYLFLALLFLALGFAGSRLLARVVRRVGGRAAWAYGALALLLLVLLVPAGAGTARGLNAALFGVALAATFAWLAAAAAASRARHAAQAAKAATPPSSPPPAPPAGSSPPGASPAPEGGAA